MEVNIPSYAESEEWVDSKCSLLVAADQERISGPHLLYICLS